MPTRKSDAIWNGELKNGNGTMKFGSGAYEGAYTFASRWEDANGTNPEELIGAALAGCFSMALANGLAKEGHPSDHVETTAEVTLEGPNITGIHLTSQAKVSGIDEDTFQNVADATKSGCPVSKVLTGTKISLDATLLK
ncbi:MAG: OsmC family protein [Balneolales bacterium]